MNFGQLLNESGCNCESASIVFNVEPVLFRKQLDNKLRSNPEAKDSVVSDLQSYVDDPSVFRKFLLPSKCVDTVSAANRSESLFKTLLAIDLLQPELITYLLERLPEFYDELEQDSSSSCTARLILHQLRWLDYIVEPEALTEKLIEIIQITPPSLQHEIITSLPDIINDSEHKPIVVYLKELMNENTSLMVPILDALSNLSLHSESLEDVREAVLERLDSAELDALPVIIKFLLQTVTPHAVDFVVFEIRQKLDFKQLSRLQMQQHQAIHSVVTKDTPEALILESIKNGLQFHKFVCDSWYKSIVALNSQREHKLIDILVLIILCSMTSMRKKVEATIKKKIIQGNLTATLIQQTVTYHSDGISGYWNTLISLAEGLLRSCQQSNSISSCAAVLYTSLFQSADAYYRQEIIGALVTHIGSNIEAEINVALDVLLKLAKSNVSNVIGYSVFIKGILEYLDNLNEQQIRALFDIFSLLALTTGNPADGSANLWAEIQTIIRKQLSNPREKYKNIGIIASLSAVKVLGSKELCSVYDNQGAVGSSTQTSPVQTIMEHPLLHQATSLIDSSLRFAKEYPSCIALIYDELAHIVSEGSIDERLELWMKENMTSDFTEFYVVGKEDALEFIERVLTEHQLNLQPELQMNLDGENDVIALKMYELMYDANLKYKKAKVVPMCSILKLMQSCEKQLNNGSLVEIDALFGCSIMMFKREDLQNISVDETEYACDMLFYTINWFRELLSTFMYSEEENFRERLVARLRSILEMEDLLNQLMRGVPNYVPLEFHTTRAIATEEYIDVNKGTQILADADAEEIESDSVEQQPTGIKRTIKKESRATHGLAFSSMDELRSCLRPFDLNILEMFKYNTEIEKEADKMMLDEISYILEDLNQKLDAKIAPPAPTLFGKKKAAVESKHSISCATMLSRTSAPELMKKIVPNLPYILHTLEALYGELQQADIEAGRIEGYEKLIRTISKICNVIYNLLQWEGLKNPDNSTILQDLIGAIGFRASGEEQHGGSALPLNTERATEYLSKFAMDMPEASTAVLLFKIIQLIMTYGESESSRSRESALKVVTHIVSTDWFDWRNIKKEIPFLLEQLIELCDDPLSLLHNFIVAVLPQYDANGAVDEFPLIKADTLLQHYQSILSQAVKALDLLKDTEQEPEVMLVQTARIVKIFERITNHIKSKEERQLLGILLKSSRLFVEQFTKYSIPYFTRVFKAHSTNIISIFKDFQSSTRMLQIICSHVKVLKDVTLAAYVPPLKRALEIVIYQVKMLLTENRIPPSAFFMGALKHRDIHGAEVSSQIPREIDSDEELVEAEIYESNGNSDQAETDSPPVEPVPGNSKKTAKSIRNNRLKKHKKDSVERRRERSVTPTTSGQRFRSAEMVPSSDDEGETDEGPSEEGSDEQREHSRNRKRGINDTEEDDDEEEEQVIEFNLDEDEEDEENIPPSPTTSSPSPPPAVTAESKQTPVVKKRRLGLARSTIPSPKRIFNLTNRSGNDSD